MRIHVTATACLIACLMLVPLASAAETTEKRPTVLLWPDGAPGAKGEASEDKPRLTPYLVPGDGPRACIVVCPGGGYAGRAGHEGEPIARWLNTLGVSGFVLDYRVRPYRHPIPLGDAQRAIRTVRARATEWRIDPRRVGILGFSAGGHLAGSATTIFDDGKVDAADPIDRQPCRPDAAVLCYAVLTFGEFRHNGSMVNLLGKDPDPALRKAMSLETRVTVRTPPVFLWHTADDGAVPVENSLLFAAALRRHKVPFALHVFPRGPHGIGLGDGPRAAKAPEARQWPALCAEWLKGIGFAPR
jgi:acetyl esterase/lipase